MIKTALLFSLIILLARPCAAELKNIVVLGDSIAAGSGVDLEEAFPARLEEKIRAADLPYRVINAGVSGDTTAGGARRISWVMRNPLDILVLELGGNDGLRGIPPGETARNLQQIIDKTRAKNPSARIVIAGMQMANNMGEEYNKAFGNLFREVAEKNDAVLVPFLLEGVGGKPELNQPDRIHPTPKGHQIVAENVWKVLKPMLDSENQTLDSRLN
jgi:acyl-CoA thioesterase-1